MDVMLGSNLFPITKVGMELVVDYFTYMIRHIIIIRILDEDIKRPKQTTAKQLCMSWKTQNRKIKLQVIKNLPMSQRNWFIFSSSGKRHKRKKSLGGNKKVK